MKKRVLFDEVMISRMITRIANEIIEQNKLEEIVLVGVKTRGIHIAKRLKKKIDEGRTMATGDDYALLSRIVSFYN